MSQQFAMVHATLDPEGPGFMRLHLISPKPGSPKGTPHALVVNGWDTIPVGESWARLLFAFLDTLNEMAIPGQEISASHLRHILDKTVGRVRRYYPLVSKNRLIGDLQLIIGQCQAIASGEPTIARSSSLSLHEYAPFMRGPLRMDLILTPMTLSGKWYCPLGCRNCYAAGQPAMNIDRMLSTAEWKQIIDKLWEIGVPQITFTGGEPTQRTDLVELVAYAQGHITRLNTSGATMTPQLAQALYTASLDGCQMTLYSDTPEIHDALVGREGAWAKTVAGIEMGLNAGLLVSVNTPLVKANADYPATLEFLHDLGVRYVGCSGLIPTGAAVGQMQADRALSNDEMYQVMLRSMETAGRLQMEPMFTSPGWLTTEQFQSLGLSDPICGAGLANMGILPNGNVSPCQSWLSNPEGLGNILTVPWGDIWNHQQLIALRALGELSECPLKYFGNGEA